MPFIDSLSKIGKTISEGAASAAKKSGELVEITKINLTISGEEDKIKNLYTEIGKHVVNKHENGENVDTDLLDYCKQVDDLNKAISELKNKIIELKNAKICSGCGCEIEKETMFCPKCGTKQENLVLKVEEPKVETLLCPACNQEVSQDTVFCTSCGHKIKE